MRSEFTLSPWAEVNRMWNLMDRYWPARGNETSTAACPIDIYEDDGRIFVRASVPGVRPENLTVNLDQRVLTITGETLDHSNDGSGSKVFLREHSYGKFVRSVRLPDDVDENAVEAEFEHGVLTVSVPLSKPRQTEPKQIPIRTQKSEAKAIPSNAYADQPVKTREHQTSGRK